MEETFSDWSDTEVDAVIRNIDEGMYAYKIHVHTLHIN